ncbi:Methyl-CpG-binding domain-containing protein 6 [Sesamum alatum]|uniref:Methyl-CpG-binding domain-containing protein 6 n=1 Tax=Sesamum alatum TaxID=300844 RepID=A0AAE1Z3I4_9LAMI|nr:Methyl-CpG-binding domain-containing protein 6 [Sesamum alatum]
MSEPQLPNPNPHSQEPAGSPTELPADAIPPDPLLESGSFIDPDRNDTGAESPQHQQCEQAPNVEFGPGVVIAAEPISMLAPAEDSPETAPRSTRRRNPEEMSKRPSWLPEDWKIDLRVRSSGATAGLIDRYYVEPSGQRKFRSKNEVLHYLETGDKRKRKPTSEADAGSSATPPSQKQKKSTAKSKKSKTLNSDTHVPNGVQTDTPQQT